MSISGTGRKENMNILLRESQLSDIPFLKEMLYEAKFWRVGVKNPLLKKDLPIQIQFKRQLIGEKEMETRQLLLPLIPFRSLQHGIDSGLIAIS